MKKIDKLVLISFIGPFFITFLVVVFIMLSKQMLSYFDDIIGKGLGWDTIGQLMFYFAIFMVPVAMPLAVLLSSLITFGNLGEHFELTAIKGAGISLLRVLRPIFLFVVALTGVAFYVNDNLVPKAALEAYSLLWDIKQKKPSMELREGEFYAGIPDIDIKVEKKRKVRGEDMLYGIMIYDHRNHSGNTDVTVADSGRMYTILNDQYLKFELFNGYNYTEGQSENLGTNVRSTSAKNTLSRSQFEKSQFIFDLSSFGLVHTDKRWFETNRIMRNISQLDHDIDSMQTRILSQRLSFYLDKATFFTYYNAVDKLPPALHKRKLEMDSLGKADRLSRQTRTTVGDSVRRPARQNMTSVKPKPKPKTNSKPKKKPQTKPKKKSAKPAAQVTPKTNGIAAATKVLNKQPNNNPPLPSRHKKYTHAQLDSLYDAKPTFLLVEGAASYARRVKNQISSNATNIDNYHSELLVYDIQWHKIITTSIACIVMFLIGAPLGSIIKRGGLGIPFLVSIFFFIIFYLLTMLGEKWAKQGVITVIQGTWLPDVALLLIGLFFMRQARIDARLFETDFYLVMWDKLKMLLDRLKLRFARV